MGRHLLLIVTLMSILTIPKISSADFTIETLQYNSDEAIDIVIIAEGFTASQQTDFNFWAGLAKDHMFATDNPPFDDNQDKFNVYRIFTVSNEQGITFQGNPEKDTALRAFRNRNGIDRYTGLPEDSRAEIRNELKKVFKKKIYLLMLINANIYGGSGDLNSNDRFFSMGQVMVYPSLFRYLVKHEFGGHAFADLADEYSSTCTDDVRPEYYDHDLFDKDNVTYDNVNDRKWDSLVADPQYYLGANYCTDEWYRSSLNGLMRSANNNLEHNELGQIITQNRIDEDIAYNEKVVTYQIDGEMNLPAGTDSNIRIHADESVLADDLFCDNLYVAEDSNLTVEYGVDINCNSTTILGTITYAQAPNPTRSERGSYRRYGCKDPLAINYTRFAAHDQRICRYDYEEIIRRLHPYGL